MRLALARWRRDASGGENVVLAVLLGALVLVLVVGSLREDWLPYSTVLVPVVVASQLLGPRRLPWLTGLALLVALVLVLERPPDSVIDVVRVLVVVSVALLVLLASRRRVRLGVPGRTGEAMLVELRDRILAQGRLGDLPGDWSVETVQHAAGGTAFAGDFVTAAVVTEPGRRRLRVVVVDVSGQGIAAGTRSLLLSGALGGLLEALPAADFLPAANRFLLGQQWEEGFATAVHLDLDLETGELAVRGAGHPPALVARAAGGAPRRLEPEGPALGLLPDATYAVALDRLEAGDAVVLYTDGVVEHPGADIDAGVDLLGSRVAARVAGQARVVDRALLEGLGRRDDDRAVVVVRRSSDRPG